MTPLTIEDQVKARIALKDVPSATKNFYRLVLGEFNRIDDAKPINNEQATAVLKKMIKSNLEMIPLVDDVNMVALTYENSIMKGFFPEENVAADMDMLIAIENSIPDHVSNKIRHMKPCIQYLEDKGFTVDKKRLSELLRELH